MEEQNTELYQLLNDVFGYQTFLPAQEQVINQILAGKSTLAIMPTGSGKSLCFQLPALLLPNLTIVVSPMISLMKDQVMQMQALGIKAEMYNSSMQPFEQSATLQKLRQNDVKLLYVAPETLLKPGFLNQLNPERIDLIAVDEAHCISMWGHEFRPEYRQLATLKTLMPQAVWFALTATATPQVNRDICALLDIPPANVVLESFNRTNLLLMVEHKIQAYQKLLNFLRSHSNESGIIYCLTRKHVDTLTDKLRLDGFAALPYHAGLSDVERHLNQEQFIKEDAQLAVATIAFGMGINKSNIRFVVHYDMPQNIESYYQEIGRSGRDGLPSTCLLMFNEADLYTLRSIIKLNENPDLIRQAYRRLDGLLAYIHTEKCRRKPILSWFGEAYDEPNCGMCDNCLQERGEKADVSVQAQKFLSAVYRSEQHFDVDYIIALLIGSQKKEITANHHDQLSVYGIGKEWKKSEWYSLYLYLKKHGYLDEQSRQHIITLNERSWNILHGTTKLMLPLALHQVLLSNQTDECDTQLFDRLTELRLSIARAKSLPAYIVFSDKTLREMATYFPQSSTAMKQISGVGEQKLQSYGLEFIRLISDYCSDKDISELAKPLTETTANTVTVSKSSKSVLVSEYLNTGHSMQETMINYDMKLDTLLNHLKTYLEAGGKVSFTAIAECITLSESELDKVVKLYEKHSLRALKPIFCDMDETVPYSELRVVQVWLLAKLSAEQN